MSDGAPERQNTTSATTTYGGGSGGGGSGGGTTGTSENPSFSMAGDFVCAAYKFEEGHTTRCFGKTRDDALYWLALTIGNHVLNKALCPEYREAFAPKAEAKTQKSRPRVSGDGRAAQRCG